MINETEQGVFDWGLDFLEMQKKNLETSIKDLSGSVWMCKADKAHIEMQIQLLDYSSQLNKD